MTATIERPIAATSVRMTYLDAIVQAQIEEMERDDRVIMMGGYCLRWREDR